jgi:hypothetical protein
MSGSLNATLGNVVELRILSSFSPSWRGDRILALLRTGNITFLPGLIFFDAFESGDTSGWSSTVP